MLLKRLAAFFFPIFVTGAAFAGEQASTPGDAQEKVAPEKSAQLGQALSVLHAVGQWSIKLSDMADKRAKSDLVKDYARAMAAANTTSNKKMMDVAEKAGIQIPALDPQSEEGKSLVARMKAETVLLGSLEGDAFDKEYMTLVTNTQQSVLHFLERAQSIAENDQVKQFLGEVRSTVQSRANSAQDIMTKIYGDQV